MKRKERRWLRMRKEEEDKIEKRRRKHMRWWHTMSRWY